MRKLKYILPALAVGVIVAAAATTSVQADKTEDNTIAERVYIGEVSVGGMTEEEAKVAVEDYVADLSDEVITLTAGDYSVETTVSELGMTWVEEEDRITEAVNLGKTGNLIDRYKVKKDLEYEDKVLPIVLTVNEEKANQFIQEHKAELNNEAVDYGLKRENGSFTITGGLTGVELVEDQCVAAINEFFAAGWVEDASVELPSEVTQPRGSEEELAKVQDVLGTFHTDFSSSASGRKQNVRNATSLIDGAVLYPGDEFSVYDAINPMNAENGYALAGSYENGTTVQTYGGGVCQVSTTLYNAVIRAELEIVERYAHSMIVGYVDPSADAAIAGTYKNLRFKNTTDAPVYIEGYTNGGTLYFTIYGQETRPSNRTVSFVSETTSTKDPGVKFTATGAKVGTVTKVQSSHVGKTAKLWKIVKVDGEVESKTQFNSSTYTASPAIYEVGTASDNPEATAAMKAAIASGDLATVQAAAAQWKDADKKPETPAEGTGESTGETTDTPENSGGTTTTPETSTGTTEESGQ